MSKSLKRAFIALGVVTVIFIFSIIYYVIIPMKDVDVSSIENQKNYSNSEQVQGKIETTTITTDRLIDKNESIDLEYWRIYESLYVKNNSEDLSKVEFSFRDEDGLIIDNYSVSVSDLKHNEIKELTEIIPTTEGTEEELKAFEIRHLVGGSVYPDDFTYSSVSVRNKNGIKENSFYFDEDSEHFYYYDKNDKKHYCDTEGNQKVEIEYIQTDENNEYFDWSYRFYQQEEWIEGGYFNNKHDIMKTLNDE